MPHIVCVSETDEDCGVTIGKNSTDAWMITIGSSLSPPIKDHTLNHGNNWLHRVF